MKFTVLLYVTYVKLIINNNLKIIKINNNCKLYLLDYNYLQYVAIETEVICYQF